MSSYTTKMKYFANFFFLIHVGGVLSENKKKKSIHKTTLQIYWLFYRSHKSNNLLCLQTLSFRVRLFFLLFLSITHNINTMFSRIRSKISKPKIAGNKSAKKSESTKTVNQKNENNCKTNDKKTVSLSDLKPCVKSKTPEFDNNPRILRRSDTFTVDDDEYPIEYNNFSTVAAAAVNSTGYDNPNYKTYTRKKEKGKKKFLCVFFLENKICHHSDKFKLNFALYI